MQLDNYLLYLEKTIEGIQDKVKRHLIRNFLANGIATDDGTNLNQLCIEAVESVNISGKSLPEQLVCCIRQSKKACLFFEKWEFEKDYKYSVVFTCDDFSAFLKKVESISPLENTYENEYMSDTFENPVAYHTDEYSFLKFNLMFAAVHPIAQEEYLLKYPFLVVLHKKSELIEFRFDVVKRIYISGKKEATIYADLVFAMREYLKSSYECTVVPLNMDFMVNVDKVDPKVKLVAQYMKLPSGGNAKLEVGNNQEYVLPFVGELRALLAAYKEDLEKVPSLRDALDQFMYEMDEMSDYPWIELLWENEIKTRSIHVKFVLDYMNKDYCLIQHYYNNSLIGMERMNYVIKYIVDHRNDDRKQIE